jgi:hypothetical protein
MPPVYREGCLPVKSLKLGTIAEAFQAKKPMQPVLIAGTYTIIEEGKGIVTQADRRKAGP